LRCFADGGVSLNFAESSASRVRGLQSRREETGPPVNPKKRIHEEAKVIRKLMAAIVVSSVPVLSFGVAQVATTGSAGAAATVTCTETSGQVLTFAPPGLSDLGTASASATWKERASSAPLACDIGGKTYTGGLAGYKPALKSTTTCSDDATPPASCTGEPGEYVVGSVGQYESAQQRLWQALHGQVSWTVSPPKGPCGGKCSMVPTSSSEAAQGTGPGNCPLGETGYVVIGHLSTSTSALAEMTTCFEGDTGQDTTGNFAADVESELGGNQSLDITSAETDPTTSSISYQ
jgi:hypothetical protein